MGTRYSVIDRDVVTSAIDIAAQDMALAISEPVGSISVSVGENLLNTAQRFQVDRALQQLRDVLREAQWPVGENFVYFTAVPAVKGQAVIESGAELPLATLDEDGVLISYNIFYGSGAGSSHQYGVAVDKIRNAIREQLSVAA